MCSIKLKTKFYLQNKEKKENIFLVNTEYFIYTDQNNSMQKKINIDF